MTAANEDWRHFEFLGDSIPPFEVYGNIEKDERLRRFFLVTFIPTHRPTYALIDIFILGHQSWRHCLLLGYAINKVRVTAESLVHNRINISTGLRPQRQGTFTLKPKRKLRLTRLPF